MLCQRHYSDKELVEGCIDKDPEAWSGLVKKYSNLISNSANNRLRKYGFDLPDRDLEDIRQNVLAALWKDELLKTVKNRKNISYWLSIVSGNIAIEYMRKKRKDVPGRPISASSEDNRNHPEELLESGLPCPSEEIANKEASERIESLIGALPAKEKLVIKLHILYDKKYEEISDILNMPPGTVSSYVKRAKEKLRGALKDFK